MPVQREAKTARRQGKRLDHLRVSKSENGGHIVEHHFKEDGMLYHKPASYTFDSGKDMLAHVAKYQGVESEDGDAD